MRRRREPVPAVRFVALAIAAGAVIAACSGSGGSDPAPTVVTTTTEPLQVRVDDGVLRIGALVPSGDTGIGALLTESIDQAIAQVNTAGGVLGEPVEFATDDEGDSPVTASQAIENLVAAGVDAIIGPTSSNAAIGALDMAVADGIVTCSATATAIALDEYPDGGLFFRTIATDSLQAIAIAGEVQATGAANVVIVHVDDAYGRPYAEAVADALDGPILVDTIAVAVGVDDLTEDIDELVAAAPQAVVVVGSGEDTARFLEGMGQREDIDVSTIIVNDDARSAGSRQVMAGLPDSIRDRVVAVAPQIVVGDGQRIADDPPFGPQLIDCVNLLALSAVQGQSDSPSVIAGQMGSVSTGGTPCRDFASCAERLADDDDNDIDYDGPTGITVLGQNGDPSRAFFDRLRFAADGSENFDSKIAVQI